MDIAVNNRNTIHFFFKCYRFVIIDIKQYSNHSAYIHIYMHREYKKLQYIAVELFLLINHPLFVSYIHITRNVTHCELL